jgi:hypothetical protein
MKNKILFSQCVINLIVLLLLLSEPPVPGNYPICPVTQFNYPSNHIQYALTWYTTPHFVVFVFIDSLFAIVASETKFFDLNTINTIRHYTITLTIVLFLFRFVATVLFTGAFIYRIRKEMKTPITPKREFRRPI